MNSITPNGDLPATFKKRPLMRVLHCLYAVVSLVSLIALLSEIPSSMKQRDLELIDLFEVFPVVAFLVGAALWGWFCMTEKIVVHHDKIVRHFIWERVLRFSDIQTIFCASTRMVVFSATEAGHVRLTLCCVTKAGKTWEKFLFPFEGQVEIVERLTRLSGIEPVMCTISDLPGLARAARRLRQRPPLRPRTNGGK